MEEVRKSEHTSRPTRKGQRGKGERTRADKNSAGSMRASTVVATVAGQEEVGEAAGAVVATVAGRRK